MDKARDQKGVTGTEFTKQQHFDRPSSSASNKASNLDVRDPMFLRDNTKNRLNTQIMIKKVTLINLS